ncbi:MAG: hypothetical protein H6779_00070 [Candidatus Nomurabacteria bacterium]|nr:MAG: hypothetical protein H6779_00070 [Candidatus Nomurabacteria bacterium]
MCNFFSLKLPELIILAVIIFSLPNFSLAASLYVSPDTGVYVAGKTFTTKIAINTNGKPINAAEGTLKFNPQELKVLSINKTGSIFNLWVTEPTFSNSAGTINFSGGMPSGYTGSSGTIFNVTFTTTAAATAKLSFTNGSVLANDGMGTNVLTGMKGGTYTIQPQTSQPAAEVVEYVPPANTPGTPQIKSTTHVNGEWSKNTTADLSWTIPAGVTAVRTNLDNSPNTIPTKVYEPGISQITLPSLDQGISYFHLQFRNSDGWGKVAHFQIKVDTEKPLSVNLSSPADADFTNPVQQIKVEAKDETSLVYSYKVKIDNEEPFDYIDENREGVIVLPPLLPGYHSVIIEAFDEAGNGLVATHSFTILAFDKPTFTEYPSEINEEVIPVIRGLSRPNAELEIFLKKSGAEPETYSILADNGGIFTFIPSGTLSVGVYELSARATDEFGAQSELSDIVKIAVQQPGYVRIGNWLISLLSIVIPLVALLILLILSVLYLINRARRFRSRVAIESSEVTQIVEKELAGLQSLLDFHKLKLEQSRKTNKLTKAESGMIEELNKSLTQAKTRISKEVADVEQVVKRKKSNN